MAFKRTASGFDKEIVDSYRETAMGTVVPEAFDDDRGGRADLDGNTRLPPPIDDPTDMVEWSRPEPSRPVSTPVVSKSAIPAAESPVCVTGPPPDPHQLQETTMASRPAENPMLDKTSEHITTVLQSLVDNPNIAQLFRAEGASSGSTSNANKSRATAPSSPEHVQVTLEGEFGRFRSKVADVIICENHVALLYTGLAGDEDLAYEPPMNKTFQLIVPMTDGQFRRLNVQHFGLITRLERLGNAVVVVLPVSPTQEEEAPSYE